MVHQLWISLTSRYIFWVILVLSGTRVWSAAALPELQPTTALDRSGEAELTPGADQTQTSSEEEERRGRRQNGVFP